MRFETRLINGRLLRRYKRFFADVEIDTDSGTEVVVAHCPNTGSMRHCLVIGGECWISRSNNPKRKLAYTLEAVSAEFGGMAGVNTGRTNKLVKEALEAKRIPELASYDRLESEVRFGEQNSRLDFRLSFSDQTSSQSGETPCLVEVKNVTMGIGESRGAFPDSVTERGRKHLDELAFAVTEGHRAVLLFCVQHTDIKNVSPAWEIDPAYSARLAEVMDLGVEVLVYGVDMTPDRFETSHRLTFDLARPDVAF